MTNEEMLAIMQGMFEKISSDMQEFKEEVRLDISEVKSDISGVKMLIENETNRNIQLLVEGYADVIERNKGVPEAIEELKTDVSVIKDVVTGHSDQINKLTKVK